MGMTWAYGAQDRDEAESIATIHRALELGVRLLDTADMYGPVHQRGTRRHARIADRRDQVFLATKCGLVVEDAGEYVLSRNGRPEHVREAIDASLRRLQTDYVDLYQLHRIDPDVPVEETWGAMAELVEKGKVGALGLSEVNVEELERAHAVHPVASVQSEGSLWTRDAFAEVVPWCAAHDAEVPAVRPARARLPDRQARAAAVPAGRLPQEQPALPEGGDGREPRARRAGQGRRRAPRRHARPGRAGVADGAGRARRADPGHQAPLAPGGERRGGAADAQRRGSRRARRAPRRPSGFARY